MQTCCTGLACRPEERRPLLRLLDRSTPSPALQAQSRPRSQCSADASGDELPPFAEPGPGGRPAPTATRRANDAPLRPLARLDRDTRVTRTFTADRQQRRVWRSRRSPPPSSARPGDCLDTDRVAHCFGATRATGLAEGAA